MKLQRRWGAAALGGMVVAAATIVATAGGAHAVGSVAPAITTDPNAANGTVAFYDAGGAQITTGPLKSFAKYAVASSDTQRTGTFKASLFVGTPDHSKTDSLQWFSQGLTAASVWPTTTAPANINAAGAKVPVVTISSTNGDGDLAGAFASAVNDPTTGYDHVMQIRLEDSGPGKQPNAPFWATDVYIDTTANTWTQLFPSVASATSTSIAAITANPVSPAAHGSTVTLTSTVTASDSSHPAGSVHLFDGTTDLGAATFTAATGAISSTVTPADGAHSYKFAFTPSGTGYSASTSAVLSYTVLAAPAKTATTTTLTASPASPSVVGSPVTLTATVTGGAAGTVQFADGATALGTPVTVASGKATFTTSALTQGSHTLNATFTPTDTAAFTGSSAKALAYTVNPVPATKTTTALTATPNGTVTQGTAVQLAATVTPTAAVGSVSFFNGSTKLATVAVSGGSASTSVSTLPVGAASLTAQFTPANAANYGSSTSSPPVVVTVKAPAVKPVVTVTATPAKAVQNASVSLKATLSVAAATGTVQFLDGGVALGSPVTVASGSATLATKFATLGGHSITAQYTSNNTGSYLDSTSAAVTVTVVAPPTATTTTLFVTPTGPAAFGSPVDLTAMITPSNAAGSVQFLDGTTKVGSPVAVSSGTASLSVSTLKAGSHSFTAAFTPTNATLFSASKTASATAYTVSPPPAATTTAVLKSTPAKEISQGSMLTLTTTITPATATGTVKFYNAGVSLGTATVKSGIASLATGDLTVGLHMLTATYTPASIATFLPSTTNTLQVTVKAKAKLSAITSGGKALKSGAVLKPGQKLTITAAGFVPGETVKVVVASTPVTVATTRASSTGAVSVTFVLPAKLAAGNHTITLVGSLDRPSFAFTVKAAAVAVPSTPTVTATPVATATPVPVATVAAVASSRTLASTGAAVIPTALVALLLLAGGLGLTTVGRRRTH